MKSSFSQMLLKLDLFGKKPLLRINKNESFRTNFGVFLTITSILLMLATLIYSSLGLWDVSKPNIILSIINTFNPPEINLSNNTFGIAFGLQNPFTYSQFIDETIYRVEVFQKIAKRNTNSDFHWEVIQLETERCSEIKFPLSYHQLLVGLPLKDMYCLKNTEFKVFGTFLNPTYAFLYIKIYECKNTTTVHNCKPKSEIDSILAGTFFSFSHTDITIDPTNYTQPNQKFMGDSYTSVSNRFFKELHHYEKQVVVRTNKGWLLDDLEEKSYLKLDYVKEMIDLRNADNFLSYTFKLSTTVETYTRSYKKVQSVAAEVGGIFKIIMLLSVLLTYMWNKAKIDETLTNELFKIIEKSGEETKEFKRIDRSSSIMILNESEIERPSVTSSINLAKDKKTTGIILKDNYFNKGSSELTITDKKKNEKETIKLTFREAFFIYIFPCCFKSRNSKILFRIGPEIDHKFEIMNIFKQLNELKRLKYILFDEDQLKLLTIPHKTIININEPIIKNSFVGMNEQISVEDCKKAYNNLKLRKNDLVSQKLLKIIEYDMKILLE
jgi:hypothetical protein